MLILRQNKKSIPFWYLPIFTFSAYLHAFNDTRTDDRNEHYNHGFEIHGAQFPFLHYCVPPDGRGTTEVSITLPASVHSWTT